MLTRRRLAPLPSRLITATLSAILLPAMGATPASAGYMRSMNCVGAGGMLSCITTTGPEPDPHIVRVPESLSAEERARAAERDRKWVARCKPVIHPDRYGVPRYYYAAPGCEFGLIGD